MASRDTAAFMALLPRAFLWQCFMPATNRLIFGYFKSRMTWKWRYKMTMLLHDKYFRKMNYYFIGEGGGTGGDKMSDADHRMVRHRLWLAFPRPSQLRHRLCLVFPLHPRLRHRLCPAFPLPSWLRHRLWLAFPPPSRLRQCLSLRCPSGRRRQDLRAGTIVPSIDLPLPSQPSIDSSLSFHCLFTVFSLPPIDSSTVFFTASRPSRTPWAPRSGTPARHSSTASRCSSGEHTPPARTTLRSLIAAGKRCGSQQCPYALPRFACRVRPAEREFAPTTRAVLQKDGPNHLGMWCNALPAHQMALITSGARYGVLPALSCMVYPVLSVYVVDSMTKVHKIWRVLGRNVGVTRAHYRETVTRVMLNSEAIAALKGVDYERQIMMTKFDTSLGALLAIHKSGYRYGTLNAFVSRFWGQFPSWYVLAPLAWLPPIVGTGEETVASIAEERGSIGLKFMLYTRSMQLWNGLFGIYRQLQMVGGNAERLIDLVVLLEKLSARKRAERSDNFVVADSIAFDSVDIITPKGVRLVNNLSFEVKRGGSLLIVGQ